MKNKICGIYCIENLINNKKYIGKGVDTYGRWQSHKSTLNNNKHFNEYLQRAWNKYGESNFKFYVIERCNKNNLVKREIYYIKKLNTKSPNGYNLTNGGEGTFGYKHSKETKKKISISAMGNKNGLGRIVSDDERRLHSIKGKNKIVSIETRLKISKSLEGLVGIYSRHFGVKQKNSFSKYHGVYPRKNKKGEIVSWRIILMNKDGRTIRFKSKGSESDAAKAYDEYVIKNNLSNPLNFPEDYKERGEK